MAESSILNTIDTATSSLIQFNPTAQLPHKLIGRLNFTTWKSQFELLLLGHDLLGYFYGSLSPRSTQTKKNDKEVPNTAYHLWLRKDELIQTALLSSVEPTLPFMVASAVSSRAAWNSLYIAYANKSQTRIFSLRDHLVI